MIFQRRMNDSDDFRSGLLRLKANRLDLRNEIDITPADVGALVQSLATIKASENQTLPVALSDLHERRHLFGYKNLFPLRFIFYGFNRRTRID
jgi:hypothetical protein